MLKNYFKIALRNLWRHRAFSFINILGLSVGMSACLLIYLYVSFELSYDRYHDKGDRIFRVVSNIKTPTDTLDWSSASLPMTPNMKSEFPEVVRFCRVEPNGMLVIRDDKRFQEDDCAMADSSLFSVFSFPLLKGDPVTALKAPFSVVLSEKTAKKYFGSANPMGQTLLLTSDKFPALVTGVMKDIPDNSHFKYDLFLSLTTRTQKFDPHADEQWTSFNGFGYVLLQNAQDAPELKAKLPAFIKKHIGPQLEKGQMSITLDLEPLKDIYLRSKRGAPESGSLSNVYIFSIIAVFILLIASINFINLATARAAERAKEVGIRKVVGAGRGQLTGQFLGESVLICFIAFLLAVGICVLLLPLFNQLSGKVISHGVFEYGSTTLTLLAIAIAIGLFAGIYPALVLSGFRPIAVLKGNFASGKKGVLLRQGLVIAQFVISIALIASTIVVNTQLDFMRNQDLGFRKEQQLVMSFGGDSTIQNHYEAFKQQLTRRHPQRAPPPLASGAIFPVRCNLDRLFPVGELRRARHAAHESRNVFHRSRFYPTVWIAGSRRPRLLRASFQVGFQYQSARIEVNEAAGQDARLYFPPADHRPRFLPMGPPGKNYRRGEGFSFPRAARHHQTHEHADPRPGF